MNLVILVAFAIDNCIGQTYECIANQDCYGRSADICTSGRCVCSLGQCRDYCGGKKFACGNGKCKPLGYRCDGEDDCGDYSDEQNCGMYIIATL